MLAAHFSTHPSPLAPRLSPLALTHTHTRTHARCTAYFSVGYLLNTFYLGALNELMYSKGDARLTSDTNSWDDFIFRRAGSLINGCGFLFQVQKCTLVSAWQARCKQRGGGGGGLHRSTTRPPLPQPTPLVSRAASRRLYAQLAPLWHQLRRGVLPRRAHGLPAPR